MRHVQADTADDDTLSMRESHLTTPLDEIGDPERKVAIMAATDSVYTSCVSLMARRKVFRNEYVVEGMLNFKDKLGLNIAELKCHEEPSTLELAQVLRIRCKATVLIENATPMRIHREHGPRGASHFTDSGTSP